MFLSSVPCVNILHISLHILSLLSMIQCQNYCTRKPFDAVHGEMYTGNVFAVVSMVGLQQCVSECISRKPHCKAVNYSRKQLSCEICSSTGNSILSDEYSKVNLEQAERDNTCPVCSEGEKCIHLSSKSARCMDDVDYITDCTALHWKNPALKSGEYSIKPLHGGKVRVFCEMETDGGGWTVFQRRKDGSVDFYRTWNEYEHGFGNLSTEFWLGNKYLYNILRQGNFELGMEMRDFVGNSTFIKYKSVSIDDEAFKYRMNIYGYSGDTGDCFTGYDRHTIDDIKFSTWDQDNDNAEENCASTYKGGWWYNRCHASNPNGLYLSGENKQHGQGITCRAWRGQYYSLKETAIMVRRTK